jgi:hypothetical protein
MGFRGEKGEKGVPKTAIFTEPVLGSLSPSGGLRKDKH